MKSSDLCAKIDPDGTIIVRISPAYPLYLEMLAYVGAAKQRAIQQDAAAPVGMSAAPAAPIVEKVPGDPYRELAELYASLWNSLEAQGEEVPDAELQAAGDELADGSWIVVFENGRWSAQQAKPDESPVEMSAGPKRAPRGGVSIAGKFYRGGLWIPGDALAKASPEQLAQIDAHNDDQAKAAADKRRARGPVDVEGLHAKLQHHAAAHDLQHPSNKEHLRSAKLMYHALQRHHGELSIHRIEELTDQAQRALDGLPEDEHGQREYWTRQLAKLHHALGMAQKQGH